METKSIPIQCHKSYLRKDLEKINRLTYSLECNKNIFDPSKSSPPNEFMEKLNKRMNIYNHLETLSSSPVMTYNMTLIASAFGK
uniref:Uncharacterized protein n=1 Tax=viral metagenome TaxID=1070528 RepID=A0A6C0BU84_9ZZZZ